MALFKVFHAVDTSDLPEDRTPGTSYVIDDGEKNFLQWKIDVSNTNSGRKGIASEALIYGDGSMVTPETITPVAYQSCVLLPNESWVYSQSENVLEQTLTVVGLKCGKDGNVPPIIQCVSNVDDYDRIIDAAVDIEHSTITFKIRGSVAPSSNIILTVIDF